jgi:hypothetical protein
MRRIQYFAIVVNLIVTPQKYCRTLHADIVVSEKNMEMTSSPTQMYIMIE